MPAIVDRSEAPGNVLTPGDQPESFLALRMLLTGRLTVRQPGTIGRGQPVRRMHPVSAPVVGVVHAQATRRGG
jgi:hypothetical protein